MARARASDGLVFPYHIPNPKIGDDDADEEDLRLIRGEEYGKTTHSKNRKQQDKIMHATHEHRTTGNTS